MSQYTASASGALSAQSPATVPSGHESASIAFREPSLSWSGVGDRSLQTIKLISDSVIRWSARRTGFSLTDSAGTLSSGTTTSGQTAVVPGTYSEVRVSARGEWTVTITPQPVAG